MQQIFEQVKIDSVPTCTGGVDSISFGKVKKVTDGENESINKSMLNLDCSNIHFHDKKQGQFFNFNKQIVCLHAVYDLQCIVQQCNIF